MALNKKRIIFLMGPTCVGKSTVIEHLRHHKNVAAVQVGKMMRAKYPPEHFQGQAAPAHTQQEATDMMRIGVLRAFRTPNIDTVIVDGNPRTQDQVVECLWLCIDEEAGPKFVLLHAEEENRRARAEATREGEDLALALDRMRGDCENGYHVLVKLLRRREYPVVIKTDIGIPIERIVASVLN